MFSDIDPAAGKRMHELARALWSLPRSITGEGVRKSLQIIAERVPGLVIHEVPSGTKVGDWVIPDEWNLFRARLLDEDGNVICDTEVNNLSVVNYSIPFSGILTREELEYHLHSLPEQPEAIPYVTSYYKPYWGFCLPHKTRQTLKSGSYQIEIDTALKPGSLTYADLVIPGNSQEEILISTYMCHPSLANNELSGPVVFTELVNYVRSIANRRFSYRFVMAPETIGAITYINTHLEHLKKFVVAAFNLTCVGDDRSYSLLPTRLGSHRIDTIARHVLRHRAPDYVEYPWSSRGSDERQYSSPLVNIPMISMMRTKYWEYPEYHTSNDDLEQVVTPQGLQGSLEMTAAAIAILETDTVPLATTVGEPMLGRRGLYSSLGAGRVSASPNDLLDVWSHCDGHVTVLEIAERLGMTFAYTLEIVKLLHQHALVSLQEHVIR